MKGIFALSLAALIDLSAAERQCYALDLFQTTTVPEYHKLTLCSTASAFCESYLSHRRFKTTSTVLYPVSTTQYTTGKTRTITKTVTSVIATRTVVAKALTVTKGKSTTSVDKCQEQETCGAQTFAHRTPLMGACQCVLQATRTVTKELVTNTVNPFTVTKLTTHITKTVTVTPTTTTTVSVATRPNCRTVAPPTCKNAGIEFAVFPIKVADTNSDPRNLTHWNLNVYKSRTPDLNDTNLYIGGIKGFYDVPVEEIYGHRYQAQQNLTVIHRGYLFAPQNGTYVFHFPAVHTIALLWVGNKAYSTWTQSNNDLSVTDAPHYDRDGPPIGGKVRMDLVAGTYYPIRVVWGLGNAPSGFGGDCYYYGPCGYFYFWLQRPDGKFVYGERDIYHFYADYVYSHYDQAVYRKTPDLLRYSCDGTTAPRFPDWGNEA